MFNNKLINKINKLLFFKFILVNLKNINNYNYKFCTTIKWVFLNYKKIFKNVYYSIDFKSTLDLIFFSHVNVLLPTKNNTILSNYLTIQLQLQDSKKSQVSFIKLNYILNKQLFKLFNNTQLQKINLNIIDSLYLTLKGRATNLR